MLLDFIQKSQQRVGVKNRLGDGKLGARLDLLPEAVQFAFAVDCRWVEAHAD